MTDIVDQVAELIGRQGAALYGGEAVTQLQHALQCAHWAEKEGGSEALVAACLLHDIGHMIAADEGAAGRGVDLRHQIVADEFLAPWFDEDVTRPIRLHVAAKRYLCARDPKYYGTLSTASIQSLKVQGGVFSKEEADAFELDPHWREAVALRQYDDWAKDPAAQTPDLPHYLDLLRRQMRA